MKPTLCLAIIALFTLGLAGCRAEGEIRDDDEARRTSYRKTTTIQPDGDRATRTEVKKSTY